MEVRDPESCFHMPMPKSCKASRMKADCESSGSRFPVPQVDDVAIARVHSCIQPNKNYTQETNGDARGAAVTSYQVPVLTKTSLGPEGQRELER